MPGARGALAPIDELARLRMLRAQVVVPVEPPPAIRRFVFNGQLPGELVPDALAEWQRARDEMGSGGDAVAAERLFYLSLLLADRYAQEGEKRYSRAIVESALECVRGARETQVLRCLMARLAVADGDAVAAAEWLAPCDASSTDLVADTAWRLTRALIATAARSWSTVLSLLGETEGDVPLSPVNQLTATVVRANALERSGRVDDAAAELRGALDRGAAPSAFDRVRASQAGLNLAPHAVARVAADARRAPSAGSGAARRRSWLAPVLTTLPMLLIGGGFLAASATADPAALTDDGYPLDSFFLLMGLAFAGVPLLMLVGGAVGRMLRAAATARSVLGQGEIVSIERTGLEINNVPQYRLLLRVTSSVAKRPYAATLKLCVPAHQLGPLQQPGARLPLRVDPSRPKRVWIAE